VHPARILFVDDDRGIQRTVGPLLSSRGFDVEMAGSGAEALKAVSARPPDLVLLDLMLPDIDGIDVCRRIRERMSTPIIVLSGRTAETDKVQALDAGADDYVTKPFGSEELLARIRVALRRVFDDDSQRRSGQVKYGELLIDYDRHAVFCKDAPVRLTPKEFELLALLARTPGRLLTHRAILRALWGPNAIDQMDHLWTLVRQLRRKIEPHPASPIYLVSEYGIGYRFAVPDDLHS
jgi:two-component system, OmpR family, KDP operon response regulator KdpE